QVPGEAREIDLTLTGNLQIQDPSGAQVKEIPVTPGETVTFKVTNAAGFDHSFYIGTDQQLSAGEVTGLTRIPTWTTAEPKEVTWTVPADVTTLKFGCTVPGHYQLMQGSFVAAAAPAAPSAPASPATAGERTVALKLTPDHTITLDGQPVKD